ncbi:Zinc finger CCCH domain-containing protein 53 [Platanthera guangdongensis]|uniref:Zinc finger CCCH domain-containing protein 53 n=1 Tax=Platanthera guangdongensis TaxID=2320717 RepID=A0ABR2LWS5_9ASPA
MDAYEATKIVFTRIQSLDPENAAKIMGLLLIQDHGEKEMIRLAFGPESLLQSVVLNARKDLGILPPSPPSMLSRGHNSSRLVSRPPPLAIMSSSLWVPPCGEELVVDELQHHEQLSFLNDSVGSKNAGDDGQSPMGGGELSPYGMGWAPRCFGADPTGLGWKPCLYFARGYCKNGSSCRFLHGLPEDAAAASVKLDAVVDQELLFRSKSQRFMSSAAAPFPYSPTGSLPPSPKCMNINFLLQHQQNESQRAASVTAAAAAAALMLGGEDPHKFIDRSRMERCDFSGMLNPGSRQIYLTFPADSTFREEDVSNYFSIYGPVQDVRIPYQQKRMFGFVTFLYPQTVKLILAKGNPHFVCDARVLVKPYKEKGKVPDKKQQVDRSDFSVCTTPTGLDSRDPYDLQQLGARMLYASNGQESLFRRKIEEQRELQQAIEMQHRRFMDLQFLDLKRNSATSSPNVVIAAPPPPFQIATMLEKDNSPKPEQELTSPKEEGDFQERAEHNLPDSPFASPTKQSFAAGDFSSLVPESDISAAAAAATSSSASPALLPSSTTPALLASSLLPATSTLENMASFKSCFFRIPRFSSGTGAVGL